MKIISLFGFLFISTSALANWQLSEAQSSLSFLSTKNDQITEISHFRRFSGSLSDSGELKVTIDLMSVDTKIEIRDTRMQEHLFKLFPKAHLRAQVPQSALTMAPGSTQTLQLEASLELNTKTKSLPMQVQITRLTNGDFVATTVEPVLVSAIEFGLTDGIKKLREIAGLSSIDLIIPVTFNAVFSA
ncbi:YceI family protein [Lacimicrobium sp. SS2-24]|uniref:YceI family protein n=1 Tax=Lacimicrobium sp. SS2-24 TaxID=2005569 RepID=UPI000B4B9BF5|nr:YceI family protein [Lacimicrobium sp. SS2-24]